MCGRVVDVAEARLTIPEGSPGPGFETAAFGPFLVVRTVDPTITPATFLQATLEVQALGAELGIGDAGRNAQTAQEALARLGAG